MYTGIKIMFVIWVSFCLGNIWFDINYYLNESLEQEAKVLDFQIKREERLLKEAKHNQWLACMAHPTWNKKQKEQKCYEKTK